jgi:hypothetical protein
MNNSKSEDAMKAATERVLSVKNNYERELMEKPNVVGVGVGFRQIGGMSTNTLALVVMVSQKMPQSLLNPTDQIPSVIEGIPVDVQEVGDIIAH